MQIGPVTGHEEIVAKNREILKADARGCQERSGNNTGIADLPDAVAASTNIELTGRCVFAEGMTVIG